MQGGEIQARGMSSLPHNRQQIANYRRSDNKKDDNILYSVMLECKVAQGTNDAFVRDVKAAPDPQCVLFFNWQLEDMERFLTREEFGIFTADTTYNLGKFYVTPSTYRHLMLEDVSTRKHPTMLGPVLVHQRMEFASFNYFGSTLVGFNKKLRNVHVFGTDGQQSMIEAFSHCFPVALHLRCFIHYRKNIKEKLKEYGIPPHVADEFVADIFGKHSGTKYEEGLVDSTSVVDFDNRLEACKNVWNSREAPYAPPSGPRFFNYFVHYKANEVCYNMRKDLREEAGLGSPPQPFTTNASESLNAMMKRKVDYKESEWPTFNEEVKQLAKQQREEVIRSLSGRGQYRLLPQYSHFAVPTATWAKMRPAQRSEVVNRFDKATLKNKISPLLSETRSDGQGPSTLSDSAVNEVLTETRQKQLSVSVERCGISKMTLTTVQFMWEKAEELISTKNAITCAPGDNRKSKMVLSYSTSIPHLVQCGTNGQYKCDEKCINWSSSGICSHSIAVAEVNNDLQAFLDWYNNSAVEPNITSLAMIGLPVGRGRKGGIPRRKRRSAQKDIPIEHVVQRQATMPAQSTASLPNACSPVPTGPLQMSTVVSLASMTTSKSIQVQPSLVFASPGASIIPQQPTFGGTAVVNTAPIITQPAVVNQSDMGQEKH